LIHFYKSFRFDTMKIIYLALLLACSVTGQVQKMMQDIEKNIKSNYEGSLQDHAYDEIKVKTSAGTILGRKRQSVKDGEVLFTYLGIPFAEAPIQNLRFKPPVPVTTYDNFKAFSFGEKCAQSMGGYILGSEDCLSLNIFAPSNDLNALKPVMVWIHGGAFVFGSGKSYDPTLLVKEDVIVVTINYRLGALGFLTFGNDVVPGNNGIRDQIVALEWVQNFIKYFGGDKNKVTIFGESAGGMSAHALQMSPKAQGLFNAVIQQSGSLLMKRDDVDVTKPSRSAVQLGLQMGAASANLDNEMLKHLQKQPFQTVINATAGGMMQWFPNVDNYSSDPVLPRDFLKAMMHGNFAKVPTLTGSILNDGALMVPQHDFQKFKDFWRSMGPMMIGVTKSGNLSECTEKEKIMANIVYKYYIGHDKTNVDLFLHEWSDMVTDCFFLSTDQKMSELVSEFAPVYNYRFDYAGKNSFIEIFYHDSEFGSGYEGDHTKVDALKPVHADDLFYLFDYYNTDTQTKEDREMQDKMVKYWTNFAKYQNPTPNLDGINQEPVWLPYGKEKNTLVINSETKMEKFIFKERMTFWQQFMWNQMECERSNMKSRDI